jgi:pimeloyl-ACP methyl ester carboxylesterase
MVLVESAEEGFLFSTEIQQALKEQERSTRRFEVEARFGLIRFQLRGDPVDAAAYSRPEYWGEALAEETSMTNAPSYMRSPGGFGQLGSLPLVVIRRGIKLPESELTGHPHRMTIAQIEQRQKEAQERLAGLSTDSVLLVAHKSGHNVNVEQPDIIVDAVKGVLAVVRRHIPLSQTFRSQ